MSDGRTATWEDYRPVGVPHARAPCDARVVTASVTPATGPAMAEAGSLDELVADAAEVTRHLLEVPHVRRDVLVIPEQARNMVTGLDSYGD
jgi:hypothetical protein